jgi:hypothetical protein
MKPFVTVMLAAAVGNALYAAVLNVAPVAIPWFFVFITK